MKRRPHHFSGFFVFLASFVSCFLLAGTAPRSLQIPSLSAAPSLDDFQGMGPSSDLARSMAKVDGFVQREPHDGEQPSHPTEVYLGYDKKHLFVVFLAFDAEPEKIRAHMSPRENVFDDDYVDVQIDTFNDQRRGYTFLATALGIQWDALWTEGQGFDEAYQAVWYSDAALTGQGYKVLITIPFSSLRFPAQTDQTWRIIFNRTIPRLNEESFWPEYTTKIDGRLNQAAIATGIRNISPGNNFQLNPYTFSRNFKVLNRGDAQFNEERFDPDGGVDAKMVLNDALVLDLTLNPDFSQVESDQPQVTVNQRFEVFFPEQRPFFLENADIFRSNTNLVFTRRIVDPRGGAKLTGKLGPWGLGAMLIDDEAPGKFRQEGDPLLGERAEVGILRLNRDLGGQSNIGLLFTDREFGQGFNRILGVDGRIKWNDNWVSPYTFAYAQTRDEDGESDREDVHYNFAANYNDTHVSSHTHLLGTGRDFHTQLGFLGFDHRPGVQNMHQFFEFNFFPKNGALINLKPTLFFTQTWLENGGPSLERTLRPALRLRWRAQTSFFLAYTSNSQRLIPDEFPVLSDDLTLSDSSWSLEFNTSPRPYFSLFSSVNLGTFVNFRPLAGAPPGLADGQAYRFDLNLRPFAPLRIDNTYFYTELKNREGLGTIFKDEILRSRWNFQFSKELSLRFIGQYEATKPDERFTALENSRNLNLDVLLRYLLNPWTALYLGYNNNASNYMFSETEQGQVVVPTPSRLKEDGRQMFVKFSYLFQF